jgi:hypothetical protein
MKIIAIISLSIAVLNLIGRPYIDAIYKEIQPDTKKHISFMKKSLSIIFRYILPIASIVFVMIYNNEVTTTFVLLVSANFFVLAVNISLHFVQLLLKHVGNSISMHGAISDQITEIVSILKQNVMNTESNTKSITSLSENLEKTVTIIRIINEQRADKT